MRPTGDPYTLADLAICRILGEKEQIMNQPQSSFERRFLVRFTGVLALLTGILYLRTILTGGLLASNFDAWEQSGVQLSLLLVIAIGGLLVAWYQEILGGGLALLAGLGISILMLFYSNERSLWAAFAYSSPFIISGLLLMIDWWKSR